MQELSVLLDIFKRDRPDLDKRVAFEWAEYLTQLESCELYSAVSQKINEEEWLKKRVAGIGGSDIAAIMGENKWNSPRQIWASKVGALDDKPPQQSEAAEWGSILEPVVAEVWARKNNKRIIQLPVTLRSIDKPWQLANIDGFILSDDGRTIEGILEIKTTSAYNKDIWENGPLPFYYVCQANWYSGITGLSEYTLVCLVGGQKLFSYDLPFDPELFARESKAADDFWHNNVLAGIEPAATEVDLELLKHAMAAEDAVAVTSQEEEQAIILDDDETERLAKAYATLRAQIGELEKLKKALQAQLILKMGTSKQALTKQYVIALNPTVRRSCDYNKLQEQYPEAYAECISITTSRTFSLK